MNLPAGKNENAYFRISGICVSRPVFMGGGLNVHIMTFSPFYTAPVVELECCILCEVCTDVAPHAFRMNSAGFVEVLPLTDYSDEKIREAVSNCPKDCITWE